MGLSVLTIIMLVILDQLGYIFPEERERRIGDDDVRLLQKLDAFCRTEIAVALQFRQDVLTVLDEPFHVCKVCASVAVHVRHLVDHDLMRDARRLFGRLRLVLEQLQLPSRDRRPGVARGDQPFELEGVEVGGEVLEKV